MEDNLHPDENHTKMRVFFMIVGVTTLIIYVYVTFN